MRMIEALYRAGVRRMEATAFVSPLAVPQLADAPDILTFAQSLPGLDVQILVPNLRNAERALAAGARHLSFVLSVSKKHNLRSEEHTSELQSLMRISYAVFCLKKKKKHKHNRTSSKT